MTDVATSDQSAQANAAKQAKAYPSKCDLVLKGGITSGVVYPGAIAWFAQNYQLHQIGGTSAGAIAAGAAAAAQLGKRSGKRPNAFDDLKTLPDELGKMEGNQSKLFRMFRPRPAADRLFATVAAAAGGGKTALLRVFLKAGANYPLSALIGALPIIVGAAVSPISPSVFGCIVQILILMTGLALGVAIALIWTLLTDAARVLPQQGWGLCAGVRRDNTVEDAGALSSWLHGYLNDLAGLERKEVLTFGHLWRGDGQAATGDVDPHQRAISFKAMTTGLNLQRPFIVPFESHDAADLYFRAEDLLEVLPGDVVMHMCAKSELVPPPERREDRDQVEAYKSAGYLRVPSPWDLPVCWRCD